MSWPWPSITWPLPTVLPEQVRKSYFVEARYQSQVWERETELPSRDIVSPEDVARLAEAFHQTHERIYAIRDPRSAVEFVNWKGRVAVRTTDRPARAETLPTPVSANPLNRRPAFFGVGVVDTPVYRGSALPPGAVVVGPAVIEEPTTTIVIYPGMSARVSAAGHFIVQIN